MEGDLTRLKLFHEIKNILKSDKQDIFTKVETLLSKSENSRYTLSDEEKSQICDTVNKMIQRWECSKRVQDRFLKKNNDWLQKNIELKKGSQKEKTNTEPRETQNDEKNSKTGRRELSFSESSERSKRRKTEELRAKVSTEALLYSATSKLRSEGNIDFAKVVRDISEGSPTKAARYRKSLESTNNNVPFTENEALSLYVELGLSQSKYQLLRNAHMEKKSRMFPAYKKIQKAKLQCYPATGMSFTENEAAVTLQSILNHTSGRIILLHMEVIKTLSEKQRENLILIVKWGCDGSSGHNEYKHKLDDENDSDEHIFFTSLVPLQLLHIDTTTMKSAVVWKNPRPSSPRYCRPIKIQCAKESVDLTKKTTDEVEDQIKNLDTFETTVDGTIVRVKYDLSLTMIDTKVCNSLTDTTSAMRCYICKCTSKDFNDIDAMLQTDIITEHLKFGISSLHCWIRCFEFLLHLSYKLEIEQWQARKPEEKQSVENRKKIMQTAFKKEMGLNVDKPKSGCGTSNDGNTARNFFEKYQQSAKITGVDQDIIYRFYIILQAISSGHEINIENFRQYSVKLARMIVNKYNWYYMPTLVHKLLIHGPEIIQDAILPIGQMSEDAQEACNKFFAIYRLNFARKNYRQKTMEDVFKRFLLASDPFISSCRKLPAKPMRSLSADTIDLLLSPSIDAEEVLESTDCSSASETETDVDADDLADNEIFFM